MGSMKISTRRRCVNLVFLLISSCFHLEFFEAFTDTILQGQSINTSQTIVSAGGEFKLGFFFSWEFHKILCADMVQESLRANLCVGS